ncbi:glutamate--tRNA ligase family protein [Fibrella sp. WM1]|uniref:glutamate--tRNA ligase family protein n=1 Tax=Fibrella musci TaxID=3242485 RepID=UPI0035206BBD
MLTRIAPTPSGYLHLGNAVNFVLTWLAARQRGGQVLLRIDDLDADRKRPEYVADVFYTLDWLGLDYDLGPSGPDDFEANWSQRHRLARYEATLDRLVAAGAVYACGWSRKQLAELGDTYPAAIRTQNLPLDAPDVAWRFRADDGSDFVVRRRDGLPAYQIASLTDDIDFGVTHLVRGQDLYDSTRMQRELAERLKLGTSSPDKSITDPGTFLRAQVWHHPLLLDASGHKLAKSAGSGAAGPTSIRAMRLAGEGPARVFEQVGTLLRGSQGILLESAQSLADLLAINAISDALFSAVQTVK